MDQQMQPKDIVTCHRYDWASTTTNTYWHAAREHSDDRGPYAYPFRTCSFCGSVHPGDALNFLKHGARAHDADWKYGWPHKFYLDGVLNPIFGKTVAIGRSFGPGDPPDGKPMMGQAPMHVPCKFYSAHLVEMPDDQFAEMARILYTHTGIQFYIGEVGLAYTSPRLGSAVSRARA